MWERELLLKKEAKLDMTFESFYEIYVEDMKNRIRDNTWGTKTNIARTKILPYFGKRKIGEIEPRDIIAWQNELLAIRQPNGKPYSSSYLQKIHSQLSAIFNHAVNFYHLPSNPAQKAGNMGKEEHREMLFWTKEEYKKFSFEMMDKDVITTPKTKKSNRTIKMPHFLCEEMQEYLGMLYGLKKKDRIFTVTKSYLHHEMDRGAKVAGVKRIRIHDLRHSYISLLIDMGFSAVAIADRVGHESIEITYQYAHLFPSKQAEMAKRLDNLGKGDFENVSQEQR